MMAEENDLDAICNEAHGKTCRARVVTREKAADVVSAERGLVDAGAVQDALYAAECLLSKECDNAHTRTCDARAYKQEQDKAVAVAKEEVRDIKNVLYGAAYGAGRDSRVSEGQNTVFSTIYGGRAPTTLENSKMEQRIAAKQHTAAWAAFNRIARSDKSDKARARAKAVHAKANHAEATRVVQAIQDETAVYKTKAPKTMYDFMADGFVKAVQSRAAEAPKDSYGCPRAATKDDVLTAYNLVIEAVAIAERANETAVSCEAAAIDAFKAHLATMDKANKSAAKTYAVTFADSHDIDAANTAATIVFKKVSRSDVGSAWDVWGEARKEAISVRAHANSMRDRATKMLEDAHAFRARVYETANAHAMATHSEAVSPK